ncbi:uncharacterized protein LOC123664967 [Melitaea cinxia]|uniref:uncharacterized protein LOC123664967 n=1 Tax=Melitaea cinxia TaxID=113334 RepID=UPI001E26FFBE|nr:uncharacterized protein LOC123664967 [Melitaea cinxia]
MPSGGSVGEEEVDARGERHRNILFTHEKNFTIEEHYNKQNGKVYVNSSKEAAQVVGKQDSAPGHKARTTEAWLETNVPDFIRVEDWLSSSRDLNPLGFKLWSVLEDMACSEKHGDIESLKKSLEQAVAKFPLETVRKSIDSWPNRLKASIKATGGHFE